jgi:hypothetical protein
MVMSAMGQRVRPAQPDQCFDLLGLVFLGPLTFVGLFVPRTFLLLVVVDGLQVQTGGGPVVHDAV